MSLDLQNLKKNIDELNELTKGEIFPKAKKDEDNNIYFVGFLKLLKKPEEPEKVPVSLSALESDDVNPDYEKYINDVNEYHKKIEIYNKLKEFVNLMVKDHDDFYSVLEKFGYEKWEECKKRQKLHYIYNCKVGVEDAEGREHKFNIFDMSVFKAQIEAGLYPDENYYKNLPEWMIDIKSFTDLIIPYDCQTIYLFNPEKKAVVDLRKDELFLLPE